MAGWRVGTQRWSRRARLAFAQVRLGVIEKEIIQAKMRLGLSLEAPVVTKRDAMASGCASCYLVFGVKLFRDCPDVVEFAPYYTR